MKYIKPKSLTWWASFFPIATGLFVASADLHGMADLVAFIDKATGGMQPAVMINAGLVGIGMRAAV